MIPEPISSARLDRCQPACSRRGEIATELPWWRAKAQRFILWHVRCYDLPPARSSSVLDEPTAPVVSLKTTGELDHVRLACYACHGKSGGAKALSRAASRDRSPRSGGW